MKVILRMAPLFCCIMVALLLEPLLTLAFCLLLHLMLLALLIHLPPGHLLLLPSLILQQARLLLLLLSSLRVVCLEAMNLVLILSHHLMPLRLRPGGGIVLESRLAFFAA